jgi:signal transduction histidine kinase
MAKDGLELPVEINAHIVDLRGQPAILSIARDITERQRSENALLEAHSQLEKRVEERTRELAQANLELKREVAERTQAEAALRESKQQLQTLTSQILTAEETERQRISRELHDGLGQTLMLLKFKLSSFVDRVCPSKDLICEYAPLFKYLDEVIENLRRLSRDLSTSVLEELGLSSSLRYLLGEFTKHFHIAASSIELDQIDRLFSPETQINIYRIYQEILTNIARHAAARKISVAAAKHDDYVVFVVEDDGLGFDLSQIASRTPPERRVGVAAMQERARISGGSLELWSQEGSGTRVTFKIPIMKHMDEHAAR